MQRSRDCRQIQYVTPGDAGEAGLTAMDLRLTGTIDKTLGHTASYRTRT